MKTSFHFFYQKTFFFPLNENSKTNRKKAEAKTLQNIAGILLFRQRKKFTWKLARHDTFSSSSNNDVLFLRRIFFDRILKRYIWKNLKHLFHGFLFLLFFDETHFLFFYHWIEKTPAWLKISSLILIFIAIIFVVRAFLNKIEIFNYSLAKLGN